MKSRTSAEGKLTIHDVDTTLSAMSNNQKQSFQENELRRLIMLSNALDQKWICKMIVKKMNLLIGTMKVLKFFHPMAPELFNKYNHLSRVVELVESGKANSAMIEVTEVFQPIRSMLCQKFTPSLNKEFLSKEIFQETKMDGERFQLHMKDNEFRYYSRNSHDYSDNFNKLITPLIKFSSVVHSVILDGEMMVYDKHESRYQTKGETMTDVKTMKESKKERFRPCFSVFDILMYNGHNLMDRAFSERHQLLHQLFEDRLGVMVKTNPIKIRDINHMVERFNIAIQNNEEGIILKEAQSKYKPGDRAGGWYKVKPDYFDDELVKDVDCVVIGGNYENIHEKNFIQRYMMGVVEKIEDGKFNVYAIGEVVHGVKVQERLKINERLKPYVIDHRGESEISFERGKIFFGNSKPHVWLPPNESIVLEIRVSELAWTADMFTPYTFRFPRIHAWRNDKSWDESETLKDFQQMYNSKDGAGGVKKTVQREVNAEDIKKHSKRKLGPSNADIVKKFCQKSQEEEVEVEVVDRVLDGKEFCVKATNPGLLEDRFKKIIRKHGGSLTVHPRKNKTFAIIAGVYSMMVKSFQDGETHNVIKGEWLFDSFGETGDKICKEMPKLRPKKDLFFVNATLKKSLDEEYDEYGDSYTELLTVEELKALLESVPTPTRIPTIEELEKFDEELEAVTVPNRNFMRRVSGAFFTPRDDNFLFNSAKTILRIRAGNVIKLEDIEESDERIIFVDQNDGIEKIKRGLWEKSILLYNLVSFRYVLDSSDALTKLDIEKYRIEM